VNFEFEKKTPGEYKFDIFPHLPKGGEGLDPHLVLYEAAIAVQFSTDC